MSESTRDTVRSGGALRFDGRTAIVTGGGSGIGREHALLLASRGANVVVNDVGHPGATMQRTDGASRAEAVAQEIRTAGGSAIGHSGSVTSDDDAASIVGTAIAEFGGVDILVNNAGVAERSAPSVTERPGEEFRDVLDVHLYGAMRMTKAVWPVMEQAGHGRILNTGSNSGFASYAGPNDTRTIGAYPIAKCALFAATRKMANAGRGKFVNVNMVLPWSITPLVRETGGASSFVRWLEVHMTGQKVAASVLWLLHESCDVTGEFVSAAGGRVSRVVFAESNGYVNPDLSPEDVRDNWDVIAGRFDGDDALSMFELPSDHDAERAKNYRVFGHPDALSVSRY